MEIQRLISANIKLFLEGISSFIEKRESGSRIISAVDHDAGSN